MTPSPKSPTLSVSQIQRWEQMYQHLVRFKEAYGHCNVPNRWSQNLQLAKWVEAQRTRHKQSNLPVYRYRKLVNIGFMFEVHKARWTERITELKAFKKEHGHCNVPDSWSAKPKLANWVTYQRTAYRQGTLSQERVKRLEAIGFVWDRPNEAWEKMYARLLRFRDSLGSCDVPYEWSEDIRLSRWVRTQRSNRKKCKLSKERIRQLNKLGFRWK